MRDYLLMRQAWVQRNGAMPEPRPLVLPELNYSNSQEAFEKFMEALGSDSNVMRRFIASGDVFVVSEDLFLTIDNRSKIDKRGRGQWLLYLAELIKQPQEVWKLNLAQTQELYLFGRFLRGKSRLDAIAVFKRNGDSGVWNEGKTIYTFEKPDGLDKKRAGIIKSGSLVWFET